MAKAISNLSTTWSNTSNIYTGIGLNVNGAAYNANSALIDLKLNSNSLMRLTSNGVLYINGAPVGAGSGGNVGPAFDAANAAFAAANAAGGSASAAAFNKANSANIVASSAYDKANSANVLAFNTGAGANAFLLTVIAGANTAVGAGANAYAATVGTSANAFSSATIAGANTAVGTGANAYSAIVGTSSNTFLLATLSGANTAVGTGANAFASATIAGANVITVAAFAVANNANLKANLAWDTANAAFATANSAGGGGAGPAFDKANSANIVASSAYDKANAALANTSGIVFAGDLNITGNINVDSATVFVDKVRNALGVRNAYPNTTVEISDAAAGGLRFSAAADSTFYRQIGRDNASTGSFIIRRAQGAGATDDLVIDTSGRVGISKTTPTAALDVTGNANVSLELTVSTINLGGADTTLGRAAAGELSVEGTIVRKVGKETIFIPAASMISRITNGPSAGTTELATNDVMLVTKDFDATTEEGVGFWIAMPKSWNESTVTFKAFWTAASGSGGVAWGLAAYSFSDDDAMDTAVSGQQIVTDTLLLANDMHITSESSAITIGGTPAEGDVVYFEITREVANGSDTIAVDAKLIGIHLYITTNASTDA